MGLIKLKIPFFYVLISAGVFISLGLYFRLPSKAVPPVSIVEMISPKADVIMKKDGRLIQPLLMVNMDCNSPSLDPLKSQVEQYIRQKTSSGEIKSASVYFSELNTAEGFSINPSEQYMPASIMKLPILITYLKDSESHPEILNKKIFFNKHFDVIPQQTRTAPPLQEGRSYTVQELLRSMIVDSDNDAVALLNQNVNLEGFKLLFRVLGLPEPDIKSWDYSLTASEVSRMMKVLFNATYLNEKNSEFAIRMLTETHYGEGFAKYIRKDVTIAHKFGERNVNDAQELHETGIFYLDNNPYLLTVMTKGSDKDMLPGILADISRTTFAYMEKPAK